MNFHQSISSCSSNMLRKFYLMVFFQFFYFYPSSSYSQTVDITMINESNYTVQVVWVNQGVSTGYGSLLPNSVKNQPSYPGHVWQFIYNGKTVGQYTATSQPRQEFRLKFGKQLWVTVRNYNSFPIQVYDKFMNNESSWGEIPSNQTRQFPAVVGHILVLKQGNVILKKYASTNQPNQELQIGTLNELITSGRYIDRDISILPIRNDRLVNKSLPANLITLPNSNFMFPDIYRVEFNPNRLFGNNVGRDYFLFATLNTFSWEYPGATVNILNKTSFRKGTKIYNIIPNYQPIGSGNSDTFGSVFLSRLPYHQNLYKGWDITLVDPRDLSSQGMREPIFKYPRPQSHDYHISETGGGVFVPDGLLIISDARGQSSSSSIVNATSYSRSLQWGVSLGVSVNVPLVASGGVNANYSQGNQSMNQNKLVSGHSSTYNVFYSLLIDFGKIRLNNQFKARVLELLAELKSGRRPDFEGFTRAYGTHYAAAMSMGGYQYCENFYSEKAFSELKQHNISIEEHVSGSLDDFGAGVSSSQKFNWSNGVKTEMEQTNSGCHSIGGSMSSSNWSMNQAGEVPIAADFRPIYTLFNLVFFDDVDIPNKLWMEYYNWFNNYMRNGQFYQISTQPPSWYR